MNNLRKLSNARRISLATLSEYKVAFKNCPQATFHNGQTVNGKIEFILEKSKTAKALVLEVRGFAKVSWTDNSKHDTVTFSGEEEYFKTSTPLVYNDGETFELKKGFHSYNFTFDLPNKIPSSYEHKYGCIRYVAKVLLDRPWKFDQQYKVVFTVINNIDLNTNPAYKVPVMIEEIKKFSSIFSNPGSLVMHVSIPKSGYVCGQIIPISVDIENNSKVRIDGVMARFKQVITFTARNPNKKRKKKKTILQEIESDGLPENFKKQLNMVFKVPNTLQSTLNTCSVIEISYHIKVKCETSGLRRDCKVKVPIIIGHLPLREGQSPQPSTSSRELTKVDGVKAPPPYEDCLPNSADSFECGDVNNHIDFINESSSNTLEIKFDQKS